MTTAEQKERIRQAVLALEICWRCQRITECEQYLAGNQVSVWLCRSCRQAAGRLLEEL